MKKPRQKFDDLRAKYLAKKAKREEIESALRVKYGPDWQASWSSRSERTNVDRARAAEEKAADAFNAHLEAIQGRDWSYGVPGSWLREELIFDDAVRPPGEKLSVVPPIAFGYTSPRT